MPLPPHSSRRFDIIILGATGTYGTIAAQQLLAWAPPGTRIGLAGRDSGKLQTLLTTLKESSAEVADRGDRFEVPELCVYDYTVDMYDSQALRAMATSTAVVASAVRADSATASDEIIRACIDAGAHYTDLQPKPGALRHIVGRFEAAARAAGVIVAPGCGFDYAVPDVAVAVAERRFLEAFAPLGVCPGRVRQVFAVRPGPHGPAFSAKWVEVLLTPSGPRSPPQPSSPRAWVLSPHAASHLDGRTSGSGPAQLPTQLAHGTATRDAAGCDRAATGTEDWAAGPPLPRAPGPWLSYCGDLRAWTIPFPLGGAAERLLFARRHQQERIKELLPHPAQRVGLQPQGAGAQQPSPGAQRRSDRGAAGMAPGGGGCELDTRIVLPLPALTPRRVLLGLLVAPLLPAALWLALWLVLLPATVVLLAARRSPALRRLLRRAAPALTCGLFTDDVSAARAAAELQFELVVTVTPSAPAADAAGDLADPGAAPGTAPQLAAPGAPPTSPGEGPRHPDSAGREGEAPTPRAPSCQLPGPWGSDIAHGAPGQGLALRLHVAGPALGRWRHLTSACLVHAALQLHAYAASRAAEEAQGGGGESAGTSRPGPAAAAAMPLHGAGVVTPAQLLAAPGCRFWEALQRESDLGVQVRQDMWASGGR